MGSVDRQQAVPTPSDLPIEHKKHTRWASPKPGSLSEPPTLFMKKTGPLSPPPEQGKPLRLPSATFDSTESQAQGLPVSQTTLESAAPPFERPADPGEGPHWPAARLAAIELPAEAVSTTAPRPLRATSAVETRPMPNTRLATPPDTPATLWVRASMGVPLRGSSPPQPSILATAMGSTVQLVQNTAALAWQALVSGSALSQESPSAGREIPSEGTPTPLASFSLLFTLLNDGSFALSGGGSMSSIGGVGPLLLGILILGGWYLLRRDSRIYLVSCESPKLTSAVLAPLEHPG